MKDTASPSSEWQTGWQAGYEFTIANYTVKTGYKVPWPKNWGNGIRGNGFAEGCITGRSFIIDRDYPGLLSMSSREGGGYNMVFKNGRKIIV